MTHLDENIDTNESPTTNEGTDRRAMLRKMAIGGAGAADRHFAQHRPPIRAFVGRR